MNSRIFFTPAALCFLVASVDAQSPSAPGAERRTAPLVITDDFRGKLGEGWKWLRENKDGWRMTEAGLQVLIEPGNMWGPSNDAKNVLLRPVPEELRDNADVSVTVSHKPQNRWEQANLVWYYSDSAMVKLGLEIENGITNIVMGREEDDKTRTIAIIPYPGESVQLRMTVRGNELTGFFREPDAKDWKEAGKTTLPAAPGGALPQISLQFYQGVAGSGRWATVKGFRLSAASAPSVPAAKSEELAAHFGDYSGVFALFQAANGTWIRPHPGECRERTTPCSTFKILNWPASPAVRSST
jgi:regulation of enolase protein 1 (concanavalin A-like superfamily)